MDLIKATDFNNREELDTYIINKYGKDTSAKIAKIIGSTKELYNLKLGHGGFVWGVIVEASDFVKKPILKRPNRGKIFKSKLNGQVVKKVTKKKNAKTNKSRSTAKRTKSNS